MQDCYARDHMAQLNDSQIYDVIVIGGGASGMMAAGRAAELGSSVLLLEKNKKLGNKLGITGGGRCNIANATFDIHEFLAQYGDGAKYLYSPFVQFGVQDTFDFFEKKGLPLVVQARKRTFPHTEKATDVVRVMRDYVATTGNVTVMCDMSVKEIIPEDSCVRVIVKNSKEFSAASCIIATGGTSRPKTGSTGDGFSWMRKFGHMVQDSTPDIVPIATDESWQHELAGVSLSFMRITFLLDNKKAFSKKGKILFTHFGLSSPLILNSARQVADLLHAGEVTAVIDCYPDTDHDKLDAHIVQAFEKYKNKDIKNCIKEITPEGLSDTVMNQCTIDPNMKVHSIPRETRRSMVHFMKAMPLTITGLMGMDRAVIADGGVSLDEIDTRTMASRIYPNIFVTGDMLHVNRPSGGYSLQLAWTTGWVAGVSAAGSVSSE